MRVLRPLLSMALLGLAGTALAEEAGVAPEEFTVQTLPAPGPHWLYVSDLAWNNGIDTRVRLLEADTGHQLGQIDAGFSPGVALSPDGHTLAVSTTYFARGGHGARTDVVEFNDTHTLWSSAEVVLPGKRAMIPPGTTSLAFSSDGKFLYVPFLTPAASLGVVDPRAHRFLGEIDTAGCALVIPNGANLVSSLCDNGRMLTITLDEQGHESARALSEPFFDPEADPVFVQGVASPTGMLFLSFLGQVHEVDLPGGAPVLHAPWSLVTAAERGHWRTGGTQVAALHAGRRRLYVPMHRGGEGTHKDGGTEIWVFDTGTHKRVARWPLAPLKLAPITSIQVSQDAQPLLYGAMSDGGVAVLDARSGKVLRVARNMGQTPWQLITP
jgi:methylamine dehydrogenase heavy chain